MKRFLLSIGISLCFLGASYGQISENFDTGLAGSYTTGTQTLSSGDWETAAVFKETSGASRSGSGAARLNDDTEGAFLTTPEIDGGVGTIQFYYRELNSGGGTMSIQKSVAGGSFVEIATQAFSGTTYSLFSFDVNDASDDIRIRIVNDDQAGHLIIDDYSSTNYSASSPNIAISPTSLEDLTYTEGNGPSSESSFQISGSNLDGDIKLEITSNFEMSTGTGGSFSATSPITLSESSGNVSETTIYVRLKSGLAAASFDSDSILVTSLNADTTNVSLTGSVVEPFSVPYTNEFRDQDDYDNATSIGFTVTSTDQRTSSGGYLKIDNGQYLQTPTIDFTEYSAIEVKFDMQDFGGSSGQEFSVLLSTDDGTNFNDTLSTNSVPGSYSTFTTIVDLTGDFSVETGKLRLEMTGGSNSTRFRDLEINEAYAVSVTGSAGWRLLSMPITGGTIADISDDTPVQGVTGGDDASADANFIIYDSDATFEQPTNVSTAWGDGYGFGLYFYDNTDNGSSELPVTLDISGSEPSTDVTTVLNPAASGYTLVGNPFASNFNTNAITSSVAAIQNTVYFWDGATYQDVDRTASGGFIAAPWQGFWVQKDATANAATITFPTSGKTTSDTTATYFKSSERRGDLRFSLTSATTRDEALRLSVRQDASLGYDLDDAGKLMPLLSEFATMAFNSPQGLKAVESLPFDLQEEITLELEPQLVGVSGTFTFAWKGMESMPTEWEIILHDYDSGANIDMRDNSEYVFTAQAEAKSKTNPLSLLSGPVATPMKAKSSSNRFGITLRPTSVNNEVEDSPVKFALEQNYPNPFNPSTTITYSVQEAGAVNISVYNLMGQKVATLVDETKAAGSYNLRWNAAGSASGMYYYRLEAGGQSITRKMTLIK